MTENVNDNLVLISGPSAVGKSASLKDMRDQEKVMYLNCESGKKLPFKNKFKNLTITDPLQIFEAFDHARDNPDYNTVVVDTLTFLMDMFESQYVLTAANTMKAWSDYNQYFKLVMQEHVAKSDKAVIFLAHTATQLNDQEAAMETKVPVKGALKGNGIESFFSCVVSAKKVPMKILEPFDGKSALLTITDEERALGFKYVFQTRLTKETVHERIRGPMGLFSREETYMDNNAQLLLDRLVEYYR